MLFKKTLRHRCFPLNFGKIFKKTYFVEHLRTATSVSLTSCFHFFRAIIMEIPWQVHMVLAAFTETVLLEIEGKLNFMSFRPSFPIIKHCIPRRIFLLRQ